MSAHLREYTAALFELDRVMRAVPAGAWDAPSPCEGWSAREVAGHAIAVVVNVGAKLGANDPVDAFADLATTAGDDPATTCRRARVATLAALDRPGTLTTPVVSSLGEMTIDDYVALMAHDALVHAWDIARATGVDERLDPWLVDLVFARMRRNGLPRAADRYGDEIDVAPDADAQTRLLAYTGRRP